MGRPIGNSGGSGGGFRPTRPSGGRPMGGMGRGHGSPRGMGHRPPPSYGRRYGAPRPPRGGYRRGRGRLSGFVSAIALVVIIGMLVVVRVCSNAAGCLGCGESVTESLDRDSGDSAQGNNADSRVTVTKNSPQNPFNTDCVADETGWYENPAKLGADLRFFYEKYGIQPYIVFKTYDSSVTTDIQRQSYCREWYSENIKDNDTFLVMYFSENSPNEVGYFTYWSGSSVDAAVTKFEKPFEEGINKNWFNKTLSMDEVMLNAFKYAAGKVGVD